MKKSQIDPIKMNQTSKINKFKTGEKTICTLVQYKLIKEESNFETNPYHKTHQTMQYTSKLDHIKPKKAKRIQAETGHDHMFNNFLSFICTLMIIYRSKHNNQKTNITCKKVPRLQKIHLHLSIKWRELHNYCYVNQQEANFCNQNSRASNWVSDQNLFCCFEKASETGSWSGYVNKFT